MGGVQIENNVLWLQSDIGAFLYGTANSRILSNTILRRTYQTTTTGGRITVGNREATAPCRQWLVRDTIAAGICVDKYSMPEGEISYCCFYGPRPQYIDAAKPGKACFTVDSKNPPILRDEKNFDVRLHPRSPCRGKASDGGDIGARITPHMWDMLQLARKIRDNSWKITPELLKRDVEEQKALKRRKQGRRIKGTR